MFGKLQLGLTYFIKCHANYTQAAVHTRCRYYAYVDRDDRTHSWSLYNIHPASTVDYR